MNFKNIINKWYFILLCLWSILLLVYLLPSLAFYPGLFSPDSLSQYNQAITHQYINTHPYMNAFLYSILLKIYNNPYVLPLLQMVITSFVLAASLTYFWLKQKKHKFVLIFIFIYYTISPVLYIYNSIVWKDVLFSVGILVLVVLMYAYYDVPRKYRAYYIVLMFSILVLTSSLRHNGLVLLITFPIIFFLTYRHELSLKLLGKYSLFLLVLVLFVYRLLPTVIGVDQKKGFTNTFPLYFISAVIDQNGIISEDDVNLINSIIPVEEMKNNYNCKTGDSIFFSSNLNVNILSDPVVLEKYNKLILRVMSNNIPIVLSNRFCIGLNLIGMGHIDDLRYYFNNLEGPILHHDELTVNKNNILFRVYMKYIVITQNSFLSIVFWRSFVPIMVLILFGAISLKCPVKRRTLSVVAIVLINLFFIILTIPAAQYRYIYFIYLITPLIPLMYMFESRDHKANK